jgi:mgtE-like transporter
MFRQSLPLLILLGICEIFAGRVFGGMVIFLDQLPGLIVLIPAIMGLKGYIDITLGSRLGSAVHMGLISPEDIWNAETKENVLASLGLGIIMAVVAGVLAHMTLVLLGLPSMGILKLIGIALAAGTLAGVILAFLTVGIMILAFKRGYDPDNITAPLIATGGDIITLSCIFAIAYLVIEVI